MSEVKRYAEYPDGGLHPDDDGDFVRVDDFDRVTAERDAALGREAALREELDEAQRVLGFSGNEADAYSTAALHDELEDCIRLSNNRELARKNSYLLVEALQQRLTAADERADVLEGLLRLLAELPGIRTSGMWERVVAALKPAEGGGDEHVCNGCGSKGWTANCKECVPY